MAMYVLYMSFVPRLLEPFRLASKILMHVGPPNLRSFWTWPSICRYLQSEWLYYLTCAYQGARWGSWRKCREWQANHPWPPVKQKESVKPEAISTIQTFHFQFPVVTSVTSHCLLHQIPCRPSSHFCLAFNVACWHAPKCSRMFQSIRKQTIANLHAL